VEYWASPGKLSPLGENFVTDHTVVLSGLEPGTTYTYRTRSVDRAGNLSESEKQTFTTLPSFTVSGLTITPVEAEIGEAVTINVLVANNMATGGTYDLSLRVGNAQESVVTVSLTAGEKKMVSFTTTRYSDGLSPVDVNGATGYLFVRTPETETSGSFPAGILAIGVLPLAGLSVVAFWLHRRRSRSWTK
jgi:hypothetical protein